MWLLYCESCVKGEGDKQDLVSPCKIGLGLHSSTCLNFLNSVDFLSSGFPIHRVGQAPYPQPASVVRKRVTRETEEQEELRLTTEEQARLGDTVIQYLFIYSWSWSQMIHPTSLP